MKHEGMPRPRWLPAVALMSSLAACGPEEEPQPEPQQPAACTQENYEAAVSRMTRPASRASTSTSACPRPTSGTTGVSRQRDGLHRPLAPTAPSRQGGAAGVTAEVTSLLITVEVGEGSCYLLSNGALRLP